MAGWCGTARGALPEYADFQLQVRSNIVDGFNLPAGSSFNSGTPALSDQGVATIRLLVVGGSGRAGLWYGGDGTGSVVYQAPVDRLLGDASINGAGQVVFEQSLDFQSEGVYRYDPSGGATVPAVPVGGPFGIEGFADPQINDAGEIGFRADRGSFQAYLRDVGGTQTQYATEGGGIAFLFVAQFNNASQLAGKVRLGSTAESQPDEIRRYEADGSFTRIAVDDDGDPGSPFVGFQNSVGIADNGWVAFVANLARGAGSSRRTAPPPSRSRRRRIRGRLDRFLRSGDQRPGLGGVPRLRRVGAARDLRGRRYRSSARGHRARPGADGSGAGADRSARQLPGLRGQRRYQRGGRCRVRSRVDARGEQSDRMGERGVRGPRARPCRCFRKRVRRSFGRARLAEPVP
ncbi:MAG: hypothetical protein R3E12_19315 [Candidatus Eisenbacteria bacterium]